MRPFSFTMLFVAALPWAAPALSATITEASKLVDNKDFVTFLTSELRLNTIARLVVQRMTAAGLACESQNVQFPNPPVGVIQLVAPITIEENAAQPSGGRWIDMVNVTFCGETRQENIFWGFNEQGRLVSAGMAPGATYMPPLRQIEFNQAAIQGTAIKDCEVIHIIDTKEGSDGVEVESKAENAALETWYFGGCGEQARRVFEFVPHLDGQLTVKTHDNSLIK